MKIEVHQLRVNVKSLAAEARIIRQEIAKAKSKDAIGCLSFHRMSRLRPEARLAHLALAYVKGVPYKTAESKTNNPVLCMELVKKLSRFCVAVEPLTVKAWLEAA